jgi:hypothetical protein
MSVMFVVLSVGLARYTDDVSAAVQQWTPAAVRPGMTESEVNKVVGCRGIPILIAGSLSSQFMQVDFPTKGIRVSYVGNKVVKVEKSLFDAPRPELLAQSQCKRP